MGEEELDPPEEYTEPQSKSGNPAANKLSPAQALAGLADSYDEDKVQQKAKKEKKEPKGEKKDPNGKSGKTKKKQSAESSKPAEPEDNVDTNGKKTVEPKQIATLTRDKLAQHDQGDVEDASVSPQESPLEKTSGESTNDQVDASGDFDKTMSSAVICYDIDDTVPVM